MMEKINWVGTVINSWEIIRETIPGSSAAADVSGNKLDRESFWVARCKVCGVEKQVYGGWLHNRGIATCRTCFPRKRKAGSPLGKRYGSLVIGRMLPKVERDALGYARGTYWECKCDCGQTVVMDQWQFTRAHNPKTHCGCKGRGLSVRQKLARAAYSAECARVREAAKAELMGEDERKRQREEWEALEKLQEIKASRDAALYSLHLKPESGNLPEVPQ